MHLSFVFLYKLFIFQPVLFNKNNTINIFYFYIIICPSQNSHFKFKSPSQTTSRKRVVLYIGLLLHIFYIYYTNSHLRMQSTYANSHRTQSHTPLSSCANTHWLFSGKNRPPLTDPINYWFKSHKNFPKMWK
jgi:hypothetical protein